MKIRHIYRYAAAAVLLTGFVLQATAIPSRPVPPRLVNDFAGILDRSQAAALESRLTAFDDTTSNQIAVVTVNDLEGYSPAEFGTEIGIEWQVGSKKFDNGIVVLVKPKTADSPGQVNISVGYGLEGAIPDSYAKRIIENEMIPAFSRNDYYTGIDNACTVLMKLASGEITEPEGKKTDNTVFTTVLGILLIIVLASIFSSRGKRKNNNNRRGGGNGGRRTNRSSNSSSNDFLKGLIIGSLLNGPCDGHHRSNGGGFGGFGGGSFGGGSFGGFGGGSFGGGGASGSW